MVCMSQKRLKKAKRSSLLAKCLIYLIYNYCLQQDGQRYLSIKVEWLTKLIKTKMKIVSRLKASLLASRK